MILEVCTGGVEDSINAYKHGADRLEINVGLELDGLTPSLASIRQIIAGVDIPVICMIRPRPGGFVYSESEFLCMIENAKICMEEGCAGIATGILLPDGSLDVERCAYLREQIGSGEFVLHRAFDQNPEYIQALISAESIATSRILTSGRGETAMSGRAVLKDLIDKSVKTEILPAVGIRANNVEDLVRDTGCTQVHAALSDKIASSEVFGSYSKLNIDRLKVMRKTLDAIA